MMNVSALLVNVAGTVSNMCHFEHVERAAKLLVQSQRLAGSFASITAVAERKINFALGVRMILIVLHLHVHVVPFWK
jgi:diadenosine tetraphosphate (Ap4A) HIT family hydrolase